MYWNFPEEKLNQKKVTISSAGETRANTRNCFLPFCGRLCFPKYLAVSRLLIICKAICNFVSWSAMCKRIWIAREYRSSIKSKLKKKGFSFLKFLVNNLSNIPYFSTYDHWILTLFMQVNHPKSDWEKNFLFLKIFQIFLHIMFFCEWYGTYGMNVCWLF